MYSFLENLRSSIDVIDHQIEYERMISALPSVTASDIDLQNWLSVLKDYNQKHRFNKGQAMVLMGILNERLGLYQSSDIKVVILEIICSVCEMSRDACSLLFETNQLVDSFVAGLNDTDMFVKYHTTKLLRCMHSYRSVVLISSLLRHPEHIRSLVSLLSGATSDFVRNECLRFLRELVAESNPDLSSFLTFQGTPEALLDILIEQSPDMPDPDVSGQVLGILRDFVRIEKSCRYVRETGCFNSRLPLILQVCLQPILNHAVGISEDDDDDDPEHANRRIQQGRTLSTEILQVSLSVWPELSSEIFHTLETCGCSPLLEDSARGDCFSYIAQAIRAGAHHTSLIDLPHFGESNPLLWRVFPLLVDENTPLPVRLGIDKVVAAICHFPDSQQMLASLMGIGLVEDEFDPRFAYIENSPSRTITSILSHATENVACRIPDNGPLVSQVWFSLSTIGHICRSNPEIEKSLLSVKISERGKSLLETVVKLAANRSSVVAETESSPGDNVSTAATLLLMEWLVSSPNEINQYIFNLHETVFLESLLDSITSLSVTNLGSVVSCVLLLLLITFGKDEETDIVAEAIGARISYSKIYKVLSDWFSTETRRTKRQYCLPMISSEVKAEILKVWPEIKKTILKQCLGYQCLSDDSARMIEVLSSENKELRNEVSYLRNQLIDWKASFAGPEQVLEENEKLRRLLNVMREEIFANETEIARIELMRDAENSAMREIINEQETQIQALVASYNQLIEISASSTVERDMKDLLELLKKVQDKYPQTKELLGRRLGIGPPSVSPSGPITSPFMRRPSPQI
jgi:hypothetical protein